MRTESESARICISRWKMKEGTLEFNEAEGKFCIANEAENSIITNLDFGDKFEVLVDGKWVLTSLAIGQNEKGEMIFNLKDTPYSEFINGIPARPLD